MPRWNRTEKFVVLPAVEDKRIAGAPDSRGNGHAAHLDLGSDAARRTEVTEILQKAVTDIDDGGGNCAASQQCAGLQSRVGFSKATHRGTSRPVVTPQQA
jgi:hypothetical protein